MKYLLLAILVAHLCLAIYLSRLEFLFVVLFSAPVLISIIVEILYLLGKTPSRTLSITGAIVLTLAVPVYISELTQTGHDAQAGLATGLMPLYQLFVLLIVSAFLATQRLFRNV